MFLGHQDLTSPQIDQPFLAAQSHFWLAIPHMLAWLITNGWSPPICWSQWSLQVWIIQCFSGVMVVLLPSDAMKMGNATFHLWMMEWHTPKFLPAMIIQCFSRVMAMLSPLEAMHMDNATSHPSSRHTFRFLQAILIQCFCGVMATLSPIELHDSTSHLWMTEWLIPKFLPAMIIQCFSGVMAMLLPSDAMKMAMRHSTFGWWNGIHPNFCRLWSYSASAEWWQCCRQSSCTMQHPTFGWWNGIHPNFCRLWSYSASAEWWQCCCRRTQWRWAMQHSVARAGNSLRRRFDMWQRLSSTARICGRGWQYCHADLLDFGWGRAPSFDSTGRRFGLADAQKDCPWIECEPPKSPSCSPRRAVAGQILPHKSRSLNCWGDSKNQSHQQPTVAEPSPATQSDPVLWTARERHHYSLTCCFTRWLIMV